MSYFDMNKGAYVRTGLLNERSITKPIEYVTKEELKEEVILAQNARSKMTDKIGQNAEYIEDLYNRHDTMRGDLNDLINYVDYLKRYISEQESAPKVGKRRRRVTILQG